MPTLELTTPTIETNATTSNILTTAVTVSTESTEITNLEHLKSELFNAVRENNVQKVMHCIEKATENKSDIINAKDDNQNTPLHLAAKENNFDIVKFLVEKGADFKVPDKYGWTPLHSAAYDSKWDVVKFLVEKGADFKVPDKDGRTPLNRAASNGNLDVVKFLVEKGADFKVPDKDVGTPLHWAAYNGKLDVVKFLVEKGADFNVPDKDGWTPLHRAASNGKWDVVKFLVEKGADLNVPDKDGWTPLHWAAYNGKLDVVKFLVEKGADFKVPDKYGGTPLHRAAYNGKWDVVKFLVEKGADFKVPGKGGRTPLNNAAEKFDDLVFEYENENKDGTVYRFLQAKHKQDKENKAEKITLNDLLKKERDTNNPFSLQKYFISYRKIKQNPEFTGRNNELKDFIICTNIDLEDSLQDSFKQIEDKDDILDIQHDNREPKRLKLEIDKFSNKENLVSILKDTSDLNRLAKTLANYVLEGKKIELRDHLFKSYHGALAKEVISTENKKFHNKFLDDLQLSNEVKEFRKAFEKEIEEHKSNWQKMEDMTIKLSGSFGHNAEHTDLPKDYVADQEIKDFFEKLVFAVNQPNETELGKIIKDEIGEEFNNIDRKNVYSRFQKKMLNWMKAKEGHFISYEDGKAFFEKVKKEILGAIWFAVRDPVELFTGREDELKKLDDALKRNQGKDKYTVISQVTSVSGLGGVGKSELARKYIYEHAQGYDNNVIWINAEDYGTIVNSFRDLAINTLGIKTENIDGKEKDIKVIVQEVYRYFANKKSLFIFDNAEKYETQEGEDAGIDKFLPSLPSNVNKPYILITSRNQEWKENVEILSLNVFSEREAMDFIKKALSIKDGSQDNEVKKLAETLQCFPLALQQAVAYIREENKKLENIGEKFSISDYLEEYKKEETKTKELLDFHLPEKNGYTRTTFITWKITLEKIKQMDYGNEALDIMDIIAYFAPNNISTKIFLERITDKRELGSALQLLKQYSMIGLEQGEANIHRLVQQVTRIELKGQNKERDVLREALNLLKKSMEEKGNPRGNPTGSIYTSHAVSAWNHASKYEELVKKFSGLPSNIINELNNSVRYEEAYLFGVKALKLLSDKLGADHYDTLNARDYVAAALDHQGRYDEALKAYQEIFDKRKQIFGPGHIFTIGTMNNIALILSHQGKSDKALADLQEISDKLKEFLDELWRMLGSDDPFPDNPLAWDMMNNIATVLSKQGKYDEALQAYQKILKKRKQTLGPDHLDTLKVRNNIAAVLGKQEKYDEALATLQETFDKLKQILGPNHPDTLLTRSNIATTLDYQGKYDEALEAYQEVFDKNKQILVLIIHLL